MNRNKCNKEKGKDGLEKPERKIRDEKLQSAFKGMLLDGYTHVRISKVRNGYQLETRLLFHKYQKPEWSWRYMEGSYHVPLLTSDGGIAADDSCSRIIEAQRCSYKEVSGHYLIKLNSDVVDVLELTAGKDKAKEKCLELIINALSGGLKR
jgi:hypothetical protein